MKRYFIKLILIFITSFLCFFIYNPSLAINLNIESSDYEKFIEDYKKDSKAYHEENENEIKMYATGNVKCQKKLYIDKKTESPTQLEIGWTNKSNKVYILYNEVEIK